MSSKTTTIFFKMAKAKSSFECEHCGYVSPSHLGRCPECQAWNSFMEVKQAKDMTETKNKRRSEALNILGSERAKPARLNDISAERSARETSGFAEFDRVLGGGILPGAYVLIGGDPGIGKSTLMLQSACQIAQHRQVLYVAGEESPYQIKLRAERLKLKPEHLLIYAENNIHQVVAEITRLSGETKNAGKKNDPALSLVVIDSIQAMYNPDVNGTPGSPSQIKECAGILMEVAKTLEVSIFLIGHVTKEGAVSGPKLLEHTVDAVLYFEGDVYNSLRILRTVKNRFGSTQEIGVFEMSADGLKEIANPSQLFLSLASYQNHPGSVIVPAMEGSRTILVELQALVGQTAYATPRRVANGVETNRLHQVVAVLERRLGLDFSRQDIYVNVVGGLSIDEPAADLGIAVAVITSLRNISVKPQTVLAGEIGLTGEIRPIRQAEPRLQEAARIGFKRMVMPVQELPSALQTDMQIIEIQTLMDALRACLSQPLPEPEQISDELGAFHI